MEQPPPPKRTATTTTTAVSTITNPNPNPRNWSELPKGILVKIARHLSNATDIPRFRGVCPAWRKSFPLSEIPNLPSASEHVDKLKIPPLYGNRFVLRETYFYFLSPLSSDDFTPPLNGNWLVRLGQNGNNNLMFRLLNPLINTGDYFIPTPPLVGEINLLDCRILELSRPMSLIDGPVPDSPYDLATESISEKIVGGFDDPGSWPDPARTFSVLVQLNDEGGLVFWRTRDKDWTKFKATFYGGVHIIFGIAYYNRKYYAFSVSEWKVGLIDPAKPGPVSMDFTLNGPDIRVDDVTVLVDGVNYVLKNVNFVVSFDKTKLYLVIEANNNNKLNNNKVRIKGMIFVYVLTKEGKWDRVGRLKDEILYIGSDATFSIPSYVLPEWDAGTICLFTRPFRMTYKACDGSHQGREMPEGTEWLNSIEYPEYWKYCRVFVMNDRISLEDSVGILPIEKSGNMKEYMYIGLFFPPPGWVKWKCPSLDDVTVKVDMLRFRSVAEEKFEAMIKEMGVTDKEWKAELKAEFMKIM